MPAESTQPGGATWHIIRIVDVFVAVQGWVWIENFADGDENQCQNQFEMPLGPVQDSHLRDKDAGRRLFNMQKKTRLNDLNGQ